MILPYLKRPEYERYCKTSVGRHMADWNRVHPFASADEKQREAIRYYEDKMDHRGREVLS